MHSTYLFDVRILKFAEISEEEKSLEELTSFLGDISKLVELLNTTTDIASVNTAVSTYYTILHFCFYFKVAYLS